VSFLKLEKTDRIKINNTVIILVILFAKKTPN